MSRCLVLCVAVLIGLSACSAEPAPRPTADLAGRLAQFGDSLERQGLRGVVEVRQGEDILFSRAYGPADQAAGVANTVDTRFRIGSVTKQFTALAILILQERGALGVDDPVCEHLAACPPAWAPITIAQLLTHTSGLGEGYLGSTPQEDERYTLALPPYADAVAIFQRAPLSGASFRYANMGYVVLGEVIERASGGSFGAFLRANVLDPLGMAASGMVLDTADGTDRSHLATGYDDSVNPVGPGGVYSYSDGGMLSTAGDLGRWNHFLLTGAPALVSPGTLAQMVTRRVDTPGAAGGGYGYGINIGANGGDPVYFHGGDVPGFLSWSEVLPGKGLSIVVLTNLHTFHPDKTVAQLAEIATQS